jgi:hypothetical protein
MKNPWRESTVDRRNLNDMKAINDMIEIDSKNDP